MARLGELTDQIIRSRVTEGASFWRGVTAHVLGTLRQEDPEQIIERTWRTDATARLVFRAASTPATTTSITWAQSLVPIGLYNFLVTLAPASAAAALYRRAVQIDFETINQAVIPKVNTAPTGTWTAEGAPAAMVQPVYGSVVVGPPRKLLFGAACTNELEQYSAESAVSIIQRTLVDAATVALDTALLDDTSADTTRPGGLLENVSDLGATSGGGSAALIGDLALIAGAMSDAKIASDDLILVCNPAEAIKIRAMLVGPLFATYTVVGSPAVSAGDLIGIAPSAIAMYVAPPQIEVSKDGLIHEDTAPRDIDTTAVSQTVRSAWQSGLILLKVRLRATWSPLATGAVQLVSSVSW